MIKENPFELKFMLKQHTPLIHFQHDQTGATLRATEVKPKLDRYVLTQLGGGDYNAGKELAKSNNWLVGKGEHGALDYKMSICSYNPKDMKLGVTQKQDQNTIFETERYPLILANMGGEKEKSDLKNFIFFEKIEITIFSLKIKEIDGETLIKTIEIFISAFFAINNFGNRQSKGFGSFYLDSNDRLFKNPKNILLKVYSKLGFWKIDKDASIKEVFTDIDFFHRLLKSGYNFPDYGKKIDKNGKRTVDKSKRGDFEVYISSYIKDFFLDKYKIGSEKREIKEKLFDEDVRIAKNSKLNGNKFVRAILGLPEFYEFRDDKRRGKVDVKSEDIKRFKSPITYKIIEREVFVIPEDWSLIKGKSFELRQNSNNSNIKVPTEEMNLIELLTGFSKQLNIIKGEEIERLESIHSQRRIPQPIKEYLNFLEYVNFQIIENNTHK